MYFFAIVIGIFFIFIIGKAFFAFVLTFKSLKRTEVSAQCLHQLARFEVYLYGSGLSLTSDYALIILSHEVRQILVPYIVGCPLQHKH